MSTHFVIPPVESRTLPTFLALSVNDDLADDSDSSSSLTSYSFGDADRATVNRHSRIPLNISDWAKRASVVVPASQKNQAGIEFLTYFKNIGLQHLSRNSHPIAILDKSLDELEAINPLELNSGIRRVAHARLNPSTYTLQLREFVFNEIPVFNIWDAIALIYSISIEDVFCGTEAELYLYQLRLILKSMRNTNCWTGIFIPSTVAASWTSPVSQKHLIVAYSFSCISGRKGSLRMDQNVARQNYNERLFSLVQLSDEELRKLDKGFNRAGNCPEYCTWATVCTKPGEYKSLCLNAAKEQTMECCGPCLETAKAAEKIGISIYDRWKICALVSETGKETKNNGEYMIKVMDPVEQILPRGRGRKVKKTRRS